MTTIKLNFDFDHPEFESTNRYGLPKAGEYYVNNKMHVTQAGRDHKEVPRLIVRPKGLVRGYQGGSHPYFVLNVGIGGRAPTVFYATIEDAERECQRLSTIGQGVFVVCRVH